MAKGRAPGGIGGHDLGATGPDAALRRQVIVLTVGQDAAMGQPGQRPRHRGVHVVEEVVQRAIGTLHPALQHMACGVHRAHLEADRALASTDMDADPGNAILAEARYPEIALIRNSGLLLEGRRQRLTRGLELYRRQLCTATEGLTLLVPAMDLNGNRQSLSTGLALIAHMLGAEETVDLVQDLRAVPPEHWPVAHTRPEPVPLGGAPDLPETSLLHIQRGLGTPDQPGVDLLRLRETEEGPLPHSPSRLETLLVSPLGWLLDELGAKDRAWAPETLDVMTLGTLMHQVLEDVFAEGSSVPDDPTLTTTVPGVLDKAIRRHAAWLSDAAWATERASLLREAQDICTAWAGFLCDTGAEVLHNEIALRPAAPRMNATRPESFTSP